MLGPTLRGEKLSLEPIQVEDLPVFCGWFANPEVTRYLLLRFPPTQKQEEEWYQRASTDDSRVNWSIVVEGRTIGSTDIHGIDWINRRGATGLVIGDAQEWGKGYASEAVRLRTAYAFEELGLERLESESFVENHAMHRALEKSGYQKIGRKRRYIYRAGVWHDLHMFELLRDEWQAQRP